MSLRIDPALSFLPGGSSSTWEEATVPTCAWDATLPRLGEGAIWDDHTHRLWWVDIDQGLLMCWQEGRTHWRHLHAPASFVTPTNRGRLLLACATGLVFIDPGQVLDPQQTADHLPPLKPTALIPPALGWLPAGMPAHFRFNDGGIDHRGRLWIGTMDPTQKDAGQLYCLELLKGDIQWRPHFPPMMCPNGIGWNREGTRMYLVDSTQRVIWVCDYDQATGQPGTPRVLADFTDFEPGILPDGLSVDNDDHLWVALWGAGLVVQLDPTGSPTRWVNVPQSRPTSPAIVSDSTGTPFLAITAAENSHEGATSLFRTAVKTHGLPSHPFTEPEDTRSPSTR